VTSVLHGCGYVDTDMTHMIYWYDKL